MRTRFLGRLLLSVAAAASVAAADQPPPTPPPQSVVVPSLPDQKNKEGTIKPEQALPTDSEGYARTNRYSPDAPTVRSGSAASAAGGASATSSGAPAGSVAPLPVGPAPTGKGITTGANTLNVRGNVQAFEPAKSVTIKIQRTGASVTYTLAEKATVPKDLKPGELVRVRINALEKGRVADRVERIPATAVPAAAAPPAT